jgi:hypothetical protein
MSQLRPLAAAALLCVLPAVHAAVDRQHLDTRFGPMAVHVSSGKTQILFKDKVVSSVPSVGAALYRVSPRNEREFVVAEVQLPRVRCSHSFVFIELFPDGTAKASNNFGECQELRAVEFNAQGAPFLRLKQGYTASSVAPQRPGDFIWKDGQMLAVAGVAASTAASAQAIADAASVVAAPASPSPLAVAATVKPAEAVPMTAKPALAVAQPEPAVAQPEPVAAQAAPVVALKSAPAAQPALAAAQPATAVAKPAPAAPVVASKPVVALAQAAVPAPAAVNPHLTAAGRVTPPTPVETPSPAPVFADKAVPSACEVAAFAAKKDGQDVVRASSMRQVGGAGRLQFYTAPTAGCEKRGLFVIHGDLLDAYAVYQNFTFVHYVNPRTGRSAEGWVLSARLVSPSREK